MPRHDADARLGHMLAAAREAAQMAQGKTRAAGRAAVIGNVLQISADREKSLSWSLRAATPRRNPYGCLMGSGITIDVVSKSFALWPAHSIGGGPRRGPDLCS